MRHFNCQQNAFLSSQKYTKIDGGGGLGLLGSGPRWESTRLSHATVVSFVFSILRKDVTEHHDDAGLWWKMSRQMAE